MSAAIGLVSLQELDKSKIERIAVRLVGSSQVKFYLLADEIDTFCNLCYSLPLEIYEQDDNAIRYVWNGAQPEPHAYQSFATIVLTVRK